MAFIPKIFDTRDKLQILSQDSQYDISCACGTREDERRRRTAENKWLYPVALPGGQTRVMFKTLISNACANDCAYCPLRSGRDVRRCTLEPHEIVDSFLGYYRAKAVFGLFISSGVTGTPDAGMERINAVAGILRKREGFRGYLHLKILPGSSDAAIEEAVSLASAVSVNIETPGQEHFRKLSARKNFLEDIIRPVKRISELTAEGTRYCRVKQTTQFVVGAADETDRELITYTEGLYNRLSMHRVYFSAYQRGVGRSDLPGEHSSLSNSDLLTREHRLYQVDWLLRKYGFSAREIPIDGSGNLSLAMDPKEHWARLHPEFYPVTINRASKEELLRVPGLGPVMVGRIIKHRSAGNRIRRFTDIARMNRLLEKASGYVRFA